MTENEDASPENLRKFLESDDPALVRMGISLAKGAGVEITAEDLKHFLKSDDIEAIKTGVLLAKEASIDVELTIEDLKKFLESYETEIARVGARLAIEIGIGDEALTLLCSRSEMNGSEEEIASMGDILAEFGEMAVGPVLDAVDYGLDEYWRIGGLVSILGNFDGRTTGSKF